MAWSCNCSNCFSRISQAAVGQETHEYRRQQLAKKLMNLLEDFSDKIDKCYFVDLFVRASNTPAIKMYEKLGYVIYRRMLWYYSGEEDGLDMRKALSRDVEKKSVIPLKRPVSHTSQTASYS